MMPPTACLHLCSDLPPHLLTPQLPLPYSEYNFDGLVGPTHNYAGLGSGNLASMSNKAQVSQPRAAALEGLDKMRLLANLGVPQAVLPPQRRPHLGYLRSCGYGHSPRELLENSAKAGDEGRRNLAIASSASSMWAANAATVSPSPDTADGRCHFTIANLASQRHRALESLERLTIFEHLFGDERYFKVHPPLPATLPDEGAANHTRLGDLGMQVGYHIFTYGFDSQRPLRGGKFQPRQSLAASKRISEQHKHAMSFPFGAECFVRQTSMAVEAGVFHNDVISVGNEFVLLIHEHAWSDQPMAADAVHHAMHIAGVDEVRITFTDDELPIADAVRSYLFNSQLVTLPGVKGDNNWECKMALVYPAECEEIPSAKAAIERILREDNPVQHAVRADVRQSMKNGGGPACLRLRVVLSDEEKAAVRGNVFWNPQLHDTLTRWVTRHYREQLTPADLADVRLYEESEAALDELAEILQLPI